MEQREKILKKSNGYIQSDKGKQHTHEKKNHADMQKNQLEISKMKTTMD